MAKIYVIYGENKEKEWIVTSYVDIYSTKKHFVKLEESVKNNEKLVADGQEPMPTKYDPSNNIADKYSVVLATSFMTFDGWKAYHQIDEYSREEIKKSVSI